jgi:hypothetical protein
MPEFERYERDLRLRGVILRQLAGEYPIERGNLLERFERMEEAYAADMPIAPQAGRIGHSSKKRRLSMRPRAVNRSHRKRNWYAMARRGKLV